MVDSSESPTPENNTCPQPSLSSPVALSETNKIAGCEFKEKSVAAENNVSVEQKENVCKKDIDCVAFTADVTVETNCIKGSFAQDLQATSIADGSTSCISTEDIGTSLKDDSLQQETSCLEGESVESERELEEGVNEFVTIWNEFTADELRSLIVKDKHGEDTLFCDTGMMLLYFMSLFMRM